jgi:hypothetical protein
VIAAVVLREICYGQAIYRKVDSWFKRRRFNVSDQVIVPGEKLHIITRRFFLTTFGGTLPVKLSVSSVDYVN